MAADSRKKDLLDRLREHIFTGGAKKLNKRDSETLEKLRKVDQLLTNGYSVSNCVRKIEADFGIAQAQAYKLIRETLALYGDAREADKKGKRYVLEEMYMKGAERALAMNDMSAYAHFLDSIARMNGLFDANAININMQQVQLPKVVIADSDLQTLKDEMESQTVINIDE